MSCRCTAHDPVIGGIEIRGDGDGKCTMGWKATKSGKTGFVTAGHCMDNSINKDVYQPSTGSAIGTGESYIYWDNAQCDCAFVEDNTGNPTISEAIYQSSSSTYDPTTKTYSSQQSGDWVKMSGKRSGNTLGTVTQTGASLPYTNGYTLHNMSVAGFSAAKGDSGAPVTNSWGTSIYGIVSGTGGVFSPVDAIQTHLGAYPVL